MVSNGMQNARQNDIDSGNDVTTPCGLKALHCLPFIKYGSKMDKDSILVKSHFSVLRALLMSHGLQALSVCKQIHQYGLDSGSNSGSSAH